MPFFQFPQAFGGEVAEAEVAEDDLGGGEEVVGAAVVAAEEEGLCLHVDVGGVGGGGGDLVGEEDGGGVQMLAHAVADDASESLDLLLRHRDSLDLELENGRETK